MSSKCCLRHWMEIRWAYSTSFHLEEKELLTGYSAEGCSTLEFAYVLQVMLQSPFFWIRLWGGLRNLSLVGFGISTEVECFVGIEMGCFTCEFTDRLFCCWGGGKVVTSLLVLELLLWIVSLNIRRSAYSPWTVIFLSLCLGDAWWQALEALDPFCLYS